MNGWTHFYCVWKASSSFVFSFKIASSRDSVYDCFIVERFEPVFKDFCRDV